MKRRILLMTLLSATMVAMATDLEHNIGVQVGWDREIYRLNTPTIFGKEKTDLSEAPLNGGRLGLVYELTHESGAGLFASLNYAYTWHRSSWEKIPYTTEGKPARLEWSNLEYRTYIQSHRLDISLQPQFKFEIAGKTYLLLYTGPTFQVIAKYQAEDQFRYNDEQQDLRYYFENKMQYNAEDMAAYYKRWNITWGLGAAFQYDIFYIRGGYDFGLVNPYNIQCFGEPLYEDRTPVFPIEAGSGQPDDRLTRGRLDGWNVTFGVFIWQSDK